AGLPVGTYLDNITIAAVGAAGSPRVVSVRFVVTSGAGLVVEPSMLNFAMKDGGANPAPAGIDVLNSGGSSPGWTGTSAASWLQLSPANGATPSTLSVVADGTGLQPGTYRATITIDAGGVSGSPRVIPVELVVQAGAGVNCAPEAFFCEP